LSSDKLPIAEEPWEALRGPPQGWDAGLP